MTEQTRSPRHRDGQPESEVERFGLRFRIDRHAGTVYEGTGPQGEPYRVVQQCDYGYLPGVMGDDGDAYDAYLGHHATCDRVYVVTQLRASNARYDEQKAMLGFKDAASAEECYRAHTHPVMLGRVGSLTLDAFKAQLAAHPGGEAVFRVETDEDAAELAAMNDIEAGPESDPEPPSSEQPLNPIQQALSDTYDFHYQQSKEGHAPRITDKVKLTAALAAHYTEQAEKKKHAPVD